MRTSAVVGRERELAHLRELVERIEEPRAVVLEGEPGIGKTTLWKECVALARTRCAHVLEARPAETETGLSFSALADLLSHVLDESLAAAAPPQRRALESALLLREPDGQTPDQRAIGTALLRVVQRLARDGPVLIAIDDAQWLDGPSRGVLQFALRRLESEAVGLLVAVRPGRLPATPLQLDEMLPDERLKRLRLGPLSLGALHRLLRRRLGRSFPRPTLLRLHQTSGGNPFFALALARALEVRGELAPGAALPVPGTLQELVRERLSALPPPVQDVLRVVAALAEPTLPLVYAAGIDGSALDDAITADVLELDGERVRFTHPLLASGVYAELGPQARATLHERLAGIVADPEQRARHLALAAVAPSPEVADALDDAAERALARGAAIAAAELRELAVRLTPDRDVEAQHRRTRLAADHYIQAGELGRSRQLLEELLAQLPHGGERADVLLGIAISREDDFAAAVELAELALREATEDPRRSAEIESFLGIAWIVRNHLARAGEHSRRALALAESHGDPPFVVKATAQVALLETWMGDVTPGLLERGLELERTLERRPDFFASPAAVLGRRLMYAGRLDEARTLFESAYDVAIDQGHELSRLALLLNLSELESRAGRWLAAAAHAAEGHELVEQRGLEQSQSGLLHVRALADAHLGRVDEARAAAEEGLALAQGVKGELFRVRNLAVLGFLELSRGDAAAADRHLCALPDLLDVAGFGDPGVCPVIPDAVEAALGIGELGRARLLADRLEAQADVVATPWARAAAARCRGLTAAAEGDEVAALESLAAAVTELEPLALPFERARALLAFGVSLRRARRRRQAREALQTALTVFDQLGAPLWAARARAELERVGGRAPARPGELTPTERRVAVLIAAGSSNRQVASALFITPRTVEGHVTHIYAKLGVHSRAELAHRFASESQGVSGV